MAFLKKLLTYVLAFILIMTVCFPPVTKQAEAKNPEIAFVATVEYIVGVFNLPNLLTGQFDFRDGWLENMTLRRVIGTDHGPLTITIKSSQQWARVDFDKIAIRGYNLQAPDIGHIEIALAPFRCPGYKIGRICAYDLVILGEYLDTASMEIPDLVVETSFDPIEAQRVLALQKRVEESDINKLREQVMLEMDQLEEGKLSQQAEAYEQLKADLPALEKDADKLKQLLESADEQSQALNHDVKNIEEVFKKVEEITDTPEWHEQLIQAKQKQSKLTTNLNGLTITLDQAEELFKNIEDKLIGYKELIALRSEYLEELELGDWSQTYQELAGIKKKLNEIAEKLRNNAEGIERLNLEKQRLTERIEEITKRLDEFNSEQPSEKMTDQVEVAAFSTKINNEIEIFLFEKEFGTFLNELLELDENLSQFNVDVIAPIQGFIDNEQWTELEDKLTEFNNEENEKSDPIELFKKQLAIFTEYKNNLHEKTEKLNAIKIKYKGIVEQVNFSTLEQQINESASKIESLEATIEDIYSALTFLMVHSELEEPDLLLIEKIIAVLEESYDLTLNETTD